MSPFNQVYLNIDLKKYIMYFTIWFTLSLWFLEKRDPMISVQSVILEGSIFKVDCSIEHSCPYSPPLIHWYRSQFLQNFTSVTFSSKRGNLWLYRETLRGIASQDMHKTQIRCSAQFRTLTTTSLQISVNVFGKWKLYCKFKWTTTQTFIYLWILSLKICV